MAGKRRKFRSRSCAQRNCEFVSGWGMNYEQPGRVMRVRSDMEWVRSRGSREDYIIFSAGLGLCDVVVVLDVSYVVIGSGDNPVQQQKAVTGRRRPGRRMDSRG